MLLRAGGHGRRYLVIFLIAKSSGLEEVGIGERAVRLPPRISGILILDVEMTEIIAEHTRISVVSGTTLVIVIFARARWLRRRLVAIAVQFALDPTHQRSPSLLNVVLDNGKIILNVNLRLGIALTIDK